MCVSDPEPRCCSQKGLELHNERIIALPNILPQRLRFIFSELFYLLRYHNFYII